MLLGIMENIIGIAVDGDGDEDGVDDVAVAVIVFGCSSYPINTTHMCTQAAARTCRNQQTVYIFNSICKHFDPFQIR